MTDTTPEGVEVARITIVRRLVSGAEETEDLIGIELSDDLDTLTAIGMLGYAHDYVLHPPEETR